MMDEQDVTPNSMTWLKIIGLLRSEGWVEQRGGMSYFNGTYGTNYCKDGEIIHISRNLYPDDEELDDLFSEEE